MQCNNAEIDGTLQITLSINDRIQQNISRTFTQIHPYCFPAQNLSPTFLCVFSIQKKASLIRTGQFLSLTQVHFWDECFHWRHVQHWILVSDVSVITLQLKIYVQNKYPSTVCCDGFVFSCRLKLTEYCPIIFHSLTYIFFSRIEKTRSHKAFSSFNIFFPS